VDGVEEVINLNDTDIEETPDFGGQICTDYILGIAKVKNQVKSLLNIDGIVSADTLTSLRTAAVGV
jgi:purine-binding chemotaxis protein CheW